MALNIIILSILSVCAIGAYSDDDFNQLEHFKSEIDECVKEIKIDRGIVESFYKDGVPNPDKNLKCFLHCLYVKIKILNENGDVNVDEMKNVVLPLAKDKTKAMALIEECSKIKEDDKCETAFAIEECFTPE
ncbi:hypothetical protein FQR65_LT09965 [Abscondita terminalis]|nr:hypothetical protein FQR65_LT09965 [Abscondita terminalis]